MNLNNHVRNKFGKTDTPENTIGNIATGFDRLGYNIHYMPFQVSDHIHLVPHFDRCHSLAVPG